MANDPIKTTVSDTPLDPVDTDRGSSFAEELERDREHRAKARSAKPLRRLIPFVLKYPWLLIAFVFFLALASTLSLLLPAAFRLVVDCGFSGDTSSPICQTFTLDGGLAGYFAAGIILAVLLGLTAALRYYFISRLGERVVADLRRAVYNHLLSLSPGYFAHIRTGEVLSRLTTDTALIQTVVGSSVSVAARTLTTTFGALILMVIVSWKLALLMLAVGPIILLPILFYGRRVQRLSRMSQDSLAEASARASESIRAIETVQAFTRESEERAHFGQAVEDTYVVSMRRIIARTFMSAIITSFTLGGLITVLWFGAVQVQDGAMSAGAMTQFVMYAFVAVMGVGIITETYAEIMRAAGATERIMELLGAKPDITKPEKFENTDIITQGEIEFTAVNFNYPSRPETQVLKNVSLLAKPRQTIALVGPSGAGKSTMFQMVLRFYDPQSGNICIDGVNIKNMDPALLRSSISIVQQNAALFSGSVAQNIQFGKTSASDEQVKAAAIAANAHEFIMALPQGYETPLGENAMTLSGGQRQRLAIARAVLRDAPILLLDEATSALDSENEIAIQKAFETVSANRTTIVIAHRLSTILRADKIVVMDEGEIVDQGTHKELLSRGGLYARLAELQFGTQATNNEEA
ncbi:MAG: ATP-binding cassette domain-containing protein [Robiginitomaculum sp.]|nr:ATP-binding cassette domain-containing protein [Robiginitomaculum sp.]